MKANPHFQNLPLEFWSNVKLISQQIGYFRKGTFIIPNSQQITDIYTQRGLSTVKVVDENGSLTELGNLIIDYFSYRRDVLIADVEANLMRVAEAKEVFNNLKAEYNPKAPLPFNKQKGEKRDYAFLTGIVNILIEAHLEDIPCNYNPLELTSVTIDNFPARTLSRRVDGAFPSTVNPIAIWEIKEYYYTTTFGSRVADGVYETLLDGFELKELKESLNINIEHYLFIDDYYTWWECGKSYLCRIVDMLHMGILTEVLFGKEVVVKLPAIVKEWVQTHRKLG